MPVTTGSTTASNAAINAPRDAETKNGPKPILFPAPSKLLKFNRICYSAPLSRRQIARQLERPVAYAQQPTHSRADRLEHAAHLAVAAFLDGHAIPAVGAFARARIGRLDTLERGASVVELDAAAQSLELARAKRALHAYRIFALDAVAGVHQAIGELAVFSQ